MMFINTVMIIQSSNNEQHRNGLTHGNKYIQIKELTLSNNTTKYGPSNLLYNKD